MVWGAFGIVSAQTARLGAEFRVNTYTTGYQRHARVAVDGSNRYVVVWESPDGSLSGIRGGRLDANGVKLGSDFQINTYTSHYQAAPVLEADSSGNFVVVWQSYRQDGSYYGVYGQRYNNSAVKAGSEFIVNTTTAYDEVSPSISRDSSGNFVVVWEGPDGFNSAIFGNRFNNVGVTQSGEFQISPNNANYKGNPAVARTGNSEFVVAWEAFGQDGSNYGIYGQRYRTNGNKNGNEFRLNTYTTGEQGVPSVAIDGSGNFVAVWQSAQDGSGFGIYGQRYSSTGAAQGTEFRVNATTAGEQRHPAVGMDTAGNFVVVWQSFLQDGSSYGIFAQRYTSAGATRGPEFRVNTYTIGNQVLPSVGVNPTNGDFLVVWDSFGQDGSLTGVYGQRVSGANCVLPTTTAPANTTVCMGGTAFFTVTPSGLGPFTYQWRKGGVNLVESSRIKGTTTATLKIKLVSAADVGSYTCVVSDFCLPPVSVTSGPGSLAVSGNQAAGVVTGLKLQRILPGPNLKLIWNNTTNATDYVIFEDTAPSGIFTTQTGTAASGVTGITIPQPSTNRYYLVAGRNAACGVGPQD